MCGLAGMLHTDGRPASPILLKRMLDAIVHRGPDGEGSFTDGSYAVGHRRLAIIDLTAAGHQPRESSDGRYVISYNGEVYNFNELRLDLEAKGYQFHSRTDTEVVLNAFCEWGAKCFNKFNGMFALAIWDKKEKSLLLARDRYGIKPLYYSSENNVLTFGSEVKALLASGYVKASMNPEGLLEYLTFQNFFSDRTLFSGVKMLPAGTFVRIQSRDGRLSMVFEKYWDYLFQEPEGKVDEGELLEELDRLFVQAVSRQLVSDVDIGSYLSGGMDSGSITAISAKQLPYIKTFTCGFDLNSASGVELGYDERSKAEYMSYLFKTEHYEMILKAGDMERVMPRLTWHLEEPRVGQSYPNFYAAQLASKFVKVILSGAGGDELFGGYPWRYYRAVVNYDFEHYIDKYYSFWQRLIPQRMMQQILSPIWGDIAHINTRDIFKNVFSNHQPNLSRPEDYVNHSLYFEAKTFLHGLLVVEDKLSMAHSLEARVPFLDNDLVNFAMKLPVRLKLGNLSDVVRLNENETGSKVAKYFEKTKDGKLLLRKMMERYIPSGITNGEKKGFSGPDSSWFKGESINYVKQELFSPNAMIYKYLDPKTVHNLVSTHLDGKENQRLLIWSLLSLEQWCKSFFQTNRSTLQKLGLK
jgi:asparagine synthase (glutamine-hydrolysing)